jgi:hypothetical protein
MFPTSLQWLTAVYSCTKGTIGKGKGKAIPLQAWKLCEATDIIKNATEELKRFTQIGIQGCFQQLYSG